MCGIVGFTGSKQAAPILLDGLSKLEYRGYDSAGIAVRDGEKDTEIVKAKGKLKVLKEMTNNGDAVKGSCGIGHTRWATHGEPSALNAHPHSSDDENVIAVHIVIVKFSFTHNNDLRLFCLCFISFDDHIITLLIFYVIIKFGSS